MKFNRLTFLLWDEFPIKFRGGIFLYSAIHYLQTHFLFSIVTLSKSTASWNLLSFGNTSTLDPMQPQQSISHDKDTIHKNTSQ